MIKGFNGDDPEVGIVAKPIARNLQNTYGTFWGVYATLLHVKIKSFGV